MPGYTLFFLMCHFLLIIFAAYRLPGVGLFCHEQTCIPPGDLARLCWKMNCWQTVCPLSRHIYYLFDRPQFLGRCFLAADDAKNGKEGSINYSDPDLKSPAAQWQQNGCEEKREYIKPRPDDGGGRAEPVISLSPRVTVQVTPLE